MKKIILIVSGIILIALLGRLGWAYYQMKSDETKVTNNDWLASTNPPQPIQGEIETSQIPPDVPSKNDIIEKMLSTHPTLNKDVVLASWSNAEKLSAENNIKKLLAYSRTQAEMYYGITNENSYTGVCANANGLLGTRNELSKLSSPAVCKDSKSAWAISAQLLFNTSQYQCADSTGFMGATLVPQVGTACPH